MRIYIIANDGIMLCRKAPATVNDGEIAVGSNEELHAAPLSAKRLLALWNALPGVEKRKKVRTTARPRPLRQKSGRRSLDARRLGYRIGLSRSALNFDPTKTQVRR